MNYEKVCESEEISFYKRFLPYSVTTPTQQLSFDNPQARANLVFFTDSHVDFFEKEECLDNVRRTVDFINNAPLNYDAVVHTGDIITPFGRHKKSDSLNRTKAFFDIAKKCRIPFIFSKGNHDLNDWDNTPDEAFTDRDWSDMFLDFAEEKFGFVRQIKKSGEKSTWHYFDIEEKKIRVVALDAQDTDKETTREDGCILLHGGSSWYISNEQMNWLASTALNFDDKDEKDWGVIFAMHQYMNDSKYHESAMEKVLLICEAFNEGRAIHIDYENENPFFNLDVNADFTRYANLEKKPHMICWLLGHEHTDNLEIRHGINMIWTLNNSATTVSSDSRIARVHGTPTQNAFDVISIDTTHRKIRAFRYGAGVNCYGVGGDRFLPDGIEY